MSNRSLHCEWLALWRQLTLLSSVGDLLPMYRLSCSQFKLENDLYLRFLDLKSEQISVSRFPLRLRTHTRLSTDCELRHCSKELMMYICAHSQLNLPEETYSTHSVSLKWVNYAETVLGAQDTNTIPRKGAALSRQGR